MSLALNTTQRETHCYRIGGHSISVESPPFRERELISRFRVPYTDCSELRLVIQVAEVPPMLDTIFASDGTAQWQEGGCRYRACLRERTQELLYRVTDLPDGLILAELSPFCAENFGTMLLLRFLDLPAWFLRQDECLLHASLIRVGDKALAFTAPKQIGKSTQAELWHQYRQAEILNGDRALLRFSSEGVTAWSTPYCGTSGICQNTGLPLGGVVILRQGPANRIRRAGGFEAAGALLSGICYDRGDAELSGRVLNLCSRLWESVPFWVMECIPEPSAVTCLDAVLREEGFYDE